jgi:hypothetical protein
MTHEIILDALRDLHCRCTCGQWEHKQRAHASDSDDYLKLCALLAFNSHIGARMPWEPKPEDAHEPLTR